MSSINEKRQRRAPLRLGAGRLAVCALLLVCTLFAFTPSAQADVRRADIVGTSTVEALGLSVAQCPSLDAEYAVLMDSTGRILFDRNAHEPTQIASITKVMTAVVAYENASLDDIVTVSEHAAFVGESSAGLAAGDTMNLETALRALLVPSGNDAAIAIAETVGAQMITADPSKGSDPETVFVDAMNRKAAEIGCTDTVYETPHGRADDDYAGSLHSTAADQALVARYAMDNRTIRSIVGGGSTSIVVSRGGANTRIDLTTTDQLLDLYDFAIGVKTGETLAAGPSFMGAASNGEIELYAVVLHSTSAYQRFMDAQALFEWGYDHLISYRLVNSTETTSMTVNGARTEVPVVAEAPLSDWVDRRIKVTVADADAAAIRLFDLDGNVSQRFSFDELKGTVRTGDKVGAVSFKQHNEVIAQYDLIACEGSSAPDFLAGLSIGWQRFLAGFTGEDLDCDPLVYNTLPLVKDNTKNAA